MSKNEKILTEYINSLSCNGCKFFVNKTCTNKNAELRNVEKADVLNVLNVEDKENINNIFVCLDFE